MFIQPLCHPFYKITFFPTHIFTLVPQECLKWSLLASFYSSKTQCTSYLELFNNKLRILSLAGTVFKTFHLLAFDSFPDSYILLISTSSIPVSYL